MVADGKSAVEIKNAITENEIDKALTVEDIDEIVLALFDEAEKADAAPAEQQTSAAVSEPAPQTSGITVGVQNAKGNIINITSEDPKVPKGKLLYDIYQGQWWATATVTGYDGKDHVIEWEFRPDGKPKMTNVPCEPARAEDFNAGKRLRAAKVPTEQMIPVEAIEKKVIDKLPNPNEVRRINS